MSQRGSRPLARCKSATFHIDGAVYTIGVSSRHGVTKSVGSPLDKESQPNILNQGDDEVIKSADMEKAGPVTIVRRTSSKSFSRRNKFHYENEFLDSIDLEAEDLPVAEAPEAAVKAAIRLRALLRRLHKGEIPASALQSNLQYAAEVLESTMGEGLKKLPEDDDELSEVEPDAVPPEVREWLASTFTKQLQSGKKKTNEKPKFRSVANAIRAGIFVERIYRRLSTATFIQLPPEVTRILKKVDNWNFDIWALSEISSTPLRCISYEFLNRYGLMHKFKIPPGAVESFLQQMESGYLKSRNPYHNNVHAADVLQTIHYMLSQTGIISWLSDLEVFATLIAALVHDFEHTGTTNNFHVMSGTDTAILYNDRAVLENHHISAAFRILKCDDTNILTNLSIEEYREFRSLVIDMVLATDMSSHFQQIKGMKTMLTVLEPTLDKSKCLSLLLHCCDISHPSKDWRMHEKWTTHLLEEFFRQGEKEKLLGLAYSPLCDRNNTLVAQSQIGFIEFIVEPSMTVCSDVLAAINVKCKNGSKKSSKKEDSSVKVPDSTDTKVSKPVQDVPRPWTECLSINKSRWKERASRDAELRSRQEEIKEEEEEEEEEEDEENDKEGFKVPSPKSISLKNKIVEVIPEDHEDI